VKLGPLPVQVIVDTDASQLRLEHGGNVLEISIDDPLALLLQLGLVLVPCADGTPARRSPAGLAAVPAAAPAPASPPVAPKTLTCPRPACGKPFKRRGNRQKFCTSECADLARRGAPATAPPPKDRLEAALAPPEEIPESGAAFHARIKEAKANGSLARRPNVIDSLRKRNEEIAARNGGRA
jgi:hypothetical protein